ncbi:MAG: LPD1 domain-containing protein [Candidatus Woesearchaeota archaeon]
MANLNEDGSLDIDGRIYGEHIGDSKADKRGGITLLENIDQIDGMSDNEKKNAVTKHKILSKFSIKDEVESGVHPGLAYVYQKLRNALPLKPPSLGDDYCKAYISLLQEIEKAYEKSKDDINIPFHTVESVFNDAIQNVQSEFKFNNFYIFNGLLNKKTRKILFYYNMKNIFSDGMYKNKNGDFDKDNKKKIPNINIKMDGSDFVIVYQTKNDRVQIISEKFKTAKEAEQYIKDNNAKIKNKVSEYKKRFDRPKITKIKRIGEDYRNGENVTPLKIMEDFGIRAVEYGKWINDKEKIEFTNYAYDALADFAKALDIDFKDVGLNGTLALAFGARGAGKAVAHYEPERKVINMTKINGAGSLAHELGHAIDYYMKDFSKTKNWKNNNLSIETFNIIDSNLSCLTIKKVPKTADDIKKEIFKARRNITSWYNYVKSESIIKMKKPFISQKDQIRKKMESYLSRINEVIGQSVLSSDKNKYKEEIEKILDNVEHDIADFGRFTQQYDVNLGGVYREAKRVIDMLDLEVEAAFGGDIGQKRIDTEFLADAKRIDSLRSGEYWSTDNEIFARAFESYIEDTLNSKEIKSPYLVHGTSADKYIGTFNDKKVYPDKEEREMFNKNFDEYIQNFKEVLEANKPQQNKLSI